MTDSVKIPLFKKADLDASIGVFFDGFSKVIVAVAILLGTFSLDGGTVFGTMMPGVLVTVLVMNGGLWLYYRHIAKSRGDANLTAVPAGLQAGRMFIWLYSIMLPVFNTTGDAEMAFKVGVLAHFIGGAVFIIGAFVVPLILQHCPRGRPVRQPGRRRYGLLDPAVHGRHLENAPGWLALPDCAVCHLPGQGEHQAARRPHCHCGGRRHCLGHRLHELLHRDGLPGRT